MSIVRSIINVLVDRMVPAIGSLLVSRLETIVTVEEAEHQSELEDRARQFDADGKPQLAAALRAKAAQINVDNPGSRGLSIIHTLQQQEQEAEVGLRLLECPRPAAEDEASGTGLTTDHAPPKALERRTRRPIANG